MSEQDATVEQVKADLDARSAKGLKKYGVTVSDNPLSLAEWLQHAYEETLDKALYLKRAIQEERGRSDLQERLAGGLKELVDILDRAAADDTTAWRELDWLCGSGDVPRLGPAYQNASALLAEAKEAQPA